MRRKFLIRVRLEQLRSNLSKADHREYSVAEVRQWLQDAGFKPVEDGWLVDQAHLGQLQPAEVEDAQIPGIDTTR